MLKKTTLYMLPLLLWLFIVFHFSFQPFSQQDITPRMGSFISEEELQEYLPEIEFNYGNSVVTYQKPFRFVQFFIRKAAHIFVYGVLGFLAIRCFINIKGNLTNRKKIISYALVSFAFITGVASTDEIIQYYNHDRSGMIEDVILDMLGGFLGIAIYLAAFGNILQKKVDME